MLRCPTNTCKGEATPKTLINVNNTYNLTADSRCVYRVNTSSWVTPTTDLKFIVSNQNLSNTATTFGTIPLTYLTKKTKLQPNQFVMAINTGLTSVSF